MKSMIEMMISVLLLCTLHFLREGEISAGVIFLYFTLLYHLPIFFCCDLTDKFVTIRGTVIRSGDIHPFFTRLSFRCKTCNTIFSLEQPDGEYTLPTHCEATGAFSCNNTSFFEPLLCAPTNVVKDCRNIKIQDVLHCDVGES